MKSKVLGTSMSTWLHTAVLVEKQKLYSQNLFWDQRKRNAQLLIQQDSYTWENALETFGWKYQTSKNILLPTMHAWYPDERNQLEETYNFLDFLNSPLIQEIPHGPRIFSLTGMKLYITSCEVFICYTALNWTDKNKSPMPILLSKNLQTKSSNDITRWCEV